jgi:hypothetical protein
MAGIDEGEIENGSVDAGLRARWELTAKEGQEEFGLGCLSSVARRRFLFVLFLLFCSVLFGSVLFCSVRFCTVLFILWGAVSRVGIVGRSGNHVLV